MKQKMTSIIIVTWNDSNVIKDCLESLLNIMDSIEIIIVDNNSSDETAKIVKQMQSPRVNLIQPLQNLGFAKANNLGFSKAQGEFILLLNPDTILSNINLAQLTKLLNDKVGLVGCRLLNKNGSLQPSCFNFDTPKNIVLEQFMLGKLLPEPLKRKFTPYLSKHNTSMYVDWLVGAFLLMTKEDFKKIHGFSTEYFMYSEDMDIAYKIRKIGKKVLFTPKYSIIHLGGVSEKQQITSSKQEKMFRSRKIFADKYSYTDNLRLFLLSYKLKFALFSIIANFSKQARRKKIEYEQTITVIKKTM